MLCPDTPFVKQKLFNTSLQLVTRRSDHELVRQLCEHVIRSMVRCVPFHHLTLVGQSGKEGVLASDGRLLWSSRG